MAVNTTAPTFTAGTVLTAANLNTVVDGMQAAWTAYTPTYTNITIGNAVVMARYSRIGKNILVRFDITGGTTSSASGAISIGLPVVAQGSGVQELFGMYATGGSAYPARFAILAGASVAQVLYGSPSVAATAFGNGAIVRVVGVYESA